MTYKTKLNEAKKDAVKVYKANFEMYEGWGICEVGKSCLDLPDDFEDEDKFFVLKSDHDLAIRKKDKEIEMLRNQRRIQAQVYVMKTWPQWQWSEKMLKEIEDMDNEIETAKGEVV